MNKNDRQHLLKLFKGLVYAKSEKEFHELQSDLEEDPLFEKYPQYGNYLMKNFGGRVESWALFSRIENELPTHGSNTTSFAEISMKVTKETQFGRMKTKNLPELLSVICDNSEVYKNKLIEIGNGRSSIFEKAKSKYSVPPSNVAEEDIADLGDQVFLVKSSYFEDTWYTCDMKSGYCTCLKGVNRAPCQHKSSVTKYFNIVEFSVVPTDNPFQCALYHYIGMGKTLEPHMYRKPGDSSVPDIESYIKQKLSEKNADVFGKEGSVENVDHEAFENDDEQFEDDEDVEKTRMQFVTAFEKYKDRLLALNLKDPANKKAIRAFTKTLTKSIGCRDLTIQTQLHSFGKGTAGARATKSGRTINPNPPAISARFLSFLFYDSNDPFTGWRQAEDLLRWADLLQTKLEQHFDPKRV